MPADLEFSAAGSFAGITVVNGKGSVVHFRNFEMTGDVGKQLFLYDCIPVWSIPLFRTWSKFDTVNPVNIFNSDLGGSFCHKMCTCVH